MNDEWGPWIGWNGGDCPVDNDTVVEGIYNNGISDVRFKGTAARFVWDNRDCRTIAYRVKKEPVVEVIEEPVIVGCDVYMQRELAKCTYTDGKLTKIHWEAE